MDDTTSRIVEDLVGRVTGPMMFRLIRGPVNRLMANGRRSARDGSRA